MDPPLINEASFTAAANPSSYSLAELLSFPTAGGGMRLRMRVGLDPSLEESTLTEHSGGNGGAKRERAAPDVSAIIPNKDLILTNFTSSVKKNDVNGKRAKVSGLRNKNDGPNTESEANSGPVPTIKLEPPKDYIHVRARRGQATDSHSLAERARREKISERMKVLQDLVPGCNKVIGKALVLDEIINYIQSLQHQVEFLSMKLEAVDSTSRMNPTMEDFPLKDLAAQAFDGSALLYGPQTLVDHARGSQVEWLHMHIGSDFNQAT